MNVFRYIRMVMWGFFGVRRAGADDDSRPIRPIPLIAVAVVLAAAFVVCLMWAAGLAVARLN